MKLENPIQPKEIQKIQTVFSHSGFDREKRLATLSNYFGFEVTTTKELTQDQAVSFLQSYKTQKYTSHFDWGRFNNHNDQHAKILSQLYELNWVKHYQGKFIPDLAKLGQWLKSHRSPVQKPIMKMTPAECTKTINALIGIAKKTSK